VTRLAPPQVMLGAASPLLGPALAGRPRTGVVLARFPTAIYVAFGEHHEVLPVVASDALMLPTAVRLPLAARDLEWGVGPGDSVAVGQSVVRLPGWSIRLVRQWRPAQVTAVPMATPERLLTLADWLTSADAVDGDLAGRAGAVLQAVLRADLPATDQLVRRLLGAGSGLTPSGDDALCAVLLVLNGLGAAPAVEVAGACVARAWTATTSLSASLLDAAREGYAVPEVAALVRAALGGDAEAASTALTEVLAIGHSSGRDLVAGLAGCLQVLARTPRSVPPPTATHQPAGRGNP
jgi:hypothetical protein